ncbi:MAG: response regulator [Deltaproteobacteria bacterium]|nr:response regulator [Deltaproteobacteria bacterium]
MAVILVIEDPHIAEVGLVQRLKDNYYDVITVANAEAAMAELHQHSPSALITDINLSDQNCIEFLENLRKNPETRQIQVFIFTDEIDIKTEAFLKGLKIFDFFTKKIDVQFLIRGVDRYYRELLQKQQQEMSGDEYGSGDETVDVRLSFQEFHKGLQQHLLKEDYDTHYELGISYMDMGIINSAIREFQMAARSPTLFQAACYMISQCFIKKNMPKEAIQSLQRGLSRDANSEEAVGLHYEMAIILKKLGKKKESLAYLQRVREKDEDFREANKLMEELEKELAQPPPDRANT